MEGVNVGCDYRSLARVENKAAIDLIQYNAGYLDGIEVLLNLESDEFEEEVDE